MMKLIFTLTLFVIGCTAVPIRIQECTYKGRPATGKILSIDIELPADNSCSTGGRICDFTSEAVYNGTIVFHAGEGSTTAYSTAIGHLGSATSTFGVNPPVNCGVGLKCPVVAGMNVTYQASVKVPCFNTPSEKENVTPDRFTLDYLC